MNSADGKWYIFYTYPRAEKVVNNELLKRNYDVFLPMYKTLRVWKNRQKKMVYQVLFPGYIFVLTKECEIHNIMRIPKVSTCIQCGGRPSIISSVDVEGIKKMLSLDQEFLVEHNFAEGENVRIVHGPLSGYEGILLKKKGNTRFGIKLKDINQVICIDVCISMLEYI